MNNESNDDYYSLRLAEVNESNPVIASENICNFQGAQLIPRGQNISRDKAALVARHKLVKPLEHCVEISNSMDGVMLYDEMKKMASKSQMVESIFGDTSYLSELKIQCKYYEKFPLIRQKLTVLANQLPNIYQHSLFSAAAGLAIAKELKLEDVDKRATFIGALMHNTGFLHLNPELTKNETLLSQDDSITVQAHPTVAKAFLDLIAGLPKAVGIAVQNHHERTDGTGYPKQKFAHELDNPSQIIAITDVICAGLERYKSYGAHANQLLFVILQFNENVHHKHVYKAAVKLMFKGPKPNFPPDKIPTPMDVLNHQIKLVSIFEEMKTLAMILLKEFKSPLSRSTGAMIGRLAYSIISSGVNQPEYQEWLESLIENNNQDDHLNLLKSHVMQIEIEQQLGLLKNIIWRNIDSIPANNSELRTKCETAFNKLSAI